MERDIKLNNFIDSLELRANQIYKEFEQFSHGVRMIMLLERKKDGGHNKEERRNIATKFSFTIDEYKRNIKELLLLQTIYPESRMYASLNSRNSNKIVRVIEEELLELHYCNDKEKKEFTHKKLIKSPRHFVMQQRCANERLFLIDADDIIGRDVCGEVLKHCEELGVEILKSYRTKNGWHIITKPFNPSLWKHESEIKKDALILLAF